MGLGGGEMWDKHFGNMQHPKAEIGTMPVQWAMSEALLEPNPMKNKKPNRAKSTS